MLVGLGIIYFSEELIKLLTTKEFYPSMYVTPVYVYFYIASIMSKISMNQICFSEKTIYLLPASIVGLLVNIILNIILIPKFSAVGAAFATAVAAFFVNTIQLYYGMKVYPLHLGKWKFVGLYFIIFIFTIPVFFIMAIDMNILAKLSIKLVIIFAFIGVGIKMHYITKSRIEYALRKVKIIK
ncbi:MAG: polysaccharide biosynthesis C-terminal domain-containing protein [bacterium]